MRRIGFVNPEWEIRKVKMGNYELLELPVIYVEPANTGQVQVLISIKEAKRGKGK